MFRLCFDNDVALNRDQPISWINDVVVHGWYRRFNSFTDDIADLTPADMAGVLQTSTTQAFRDLQFYKM